MNDIGPCGLCREIVEGASFHPNCCDHEDVEEDDGRDGGGGRLRYWCNDCDSEVTAFPNEDGGLDWETVE